MQGMLNMNFLEMTELLSNFKPGLYRLDRRVKNPAGDKRRRYGWEGLAEFEPGLYLVTEDFYKQTEEQFPEIMDKVSIRHLKFYRLERGRRTFGFQQTTWNADLISDDYNQRACVLVQALVPETSVGAQLKALFAGGNASEFEVICRLVKQGTLTLEAVTAAYQEVADAYAAAEEKV